MHGGLSTGPRTAAGLARMASIGAASAQVIIQALAVINIIFGLFRLPYGDQGLLIHRDLYRAVGGYRRLPLMEDVDLVRRIGRDNLVPLAADALTSAARYRRDGWLLRPLRNLTCLTLYFAGVPPQTLQRLYGR